MQWLFTLQIATGHLPQKVDFPNNLFSFLGREGLNFLPLSYSLNFRVFGGKR